MVTKDTNINTMEINILKERLRDGVLFLKRVDKKKRKYSQPRKFFFVWDIGEFSSEEGWLVFPSEY